MTSTTERLPEPAVVNRPNLLVATRSRTVPTVVLILVSMMAMFAAVANRFSHASFSNDSVRTLKADSSEVPSVVFPGSPGVIRAAQVPRQPDSQKDISLETPGELQLEGDKDTAYKRPEPIHPETGESVRAEIVTCPGCRLNALPEVKYFLNNQAEQFSPSLKVTYIPGEEPTMKIFSGDKEIENFALDNYSWKGIMKKLVRVGIYPAALTPTVKEVLPNLN